MRGNAAHAIQRAATLLTLLFLLGSIHPLPAQLPGGWEDSIVNVEVARKQYDYTQPWAKRNRSAQKSAIVTGPREILCTAEELTDRTLVRLQRDGRGKWWNGRVTWMDYHANLALLTVDDDAFWPGLQPAKIGGGKIPKDGLQIVRWKNGNLETRKAEFTQFLVDDGRLTYANHLQVDVNCDMTGVGWCEPVVAGGALVAITTGQSGNTCRALPVAFFQPILEAARKNSFRGLGHFHFVWQPTENPATHRFLKLPGEPRGVVVIDVPKVPGAPDTVKPRDLILAVDGFDIDVQGYYRDPDCGLLILENLATRRHFAGDTVKLKLWRDGATLEVDYQLPKVEYSLKLLPERVLDQEPEYMILGGLVFQPMTGEFLRSFGADWKRTAPFRLAYYHNDQPTPERSGLVILSSILPDSFNLGYQDYRYLVVDRVNGQKISRLADLRAALAKPADGFHTVEFVRSDGLRRMVLDAASLDEATQRVLQQYRIVKDQVVVNGK
ncbi:MAG: hypothetical protein HZA89_00285 [Verrucomicrobia bacterium]|nr:hypothetical protein [Verrucomicrobiota bacterium]